MKRNEPALNEINSLDFHGHKTQSRSITTNKPNSKRKWAIQANLHFSLPTRPVLLFSITMGQI